VRTVPRRSVAPLCPDCPGSTTGVEVVFGLPSANLFEAADRGEAVLAGCMPPLDEPEPRWACPRCERFLA
jgi:hypothetical protein